MLTRGFATPPPNKKITYIKKFVKCERGTKTGLPQNPIGFVGWRNGSRQGEAVVLQKNAANQKACRDAAVPYGFVF